MLCKLRATNIYSEKVCHLILMGGMRVTVFTRTHKKAPFLPTREKPDLLILGNKLPPAAELPSWSKIDRPPAAELPLRQQAVIQAAELSSSYTPKPSTVPTHPYHPTKSATTHATMTHTTTTPRTHTPHRPANLNAVTTHLRPKYDHIYLITLPQNLYFPLQK